MKVSVIIPVFNAGCYVAQAVRSALAQPETGEVILVEDGSSDDSLRICRSLADTHKKVRLFMHENGRNRGPIVSRNLGIRRARYDFIAFLDDDDYYLPNRFKATKNTFSRYPDTDGVYEAVGVFFETEASEKRWKTIGKSDLITIKAGIPPEQLFEKQSPIGSNGYCQLDGLTVKKKVFKKSGLFDLGVRAEDTTLFLKLSACAKLQPGSLNAPVAYRRIHSSNNFAQMRTKHELWSDRFMLWTTLYRWMKNGHPDNPKINTILGKMLWDTHGIVEADSSHIQIFWTALWRCSFSFLKCPDLFKERKYVLGVGRHLLECLK